MVLRLVDSSPLTPEFDSLVQRQLEKWKVPGMTVAVIHGSNTHSKAYGIAELPDKKMATDSLFSTCSTTKAFTATAVSLAIDDRKKTSSPISWDTPVASLIRDDFVMADDYATMNTTLEDALSHRSGLPGHLGAMMLASPKETLRDAVRKLRHFPMAYAPRTTFDYCNHMYMVVSHALEQMTGQTLGATLKNRIWNPLGMQDTYFSIEEAKSRPSSSSRLVRGYTWDSETKAYAAEPYMDYAPTTGTGAIVSNVLDYTKWLRTMIYQNGPISRTGYADIVRPRTIIANDDDIVAPPGPHHLYALGWFVDNYHGEQLYWHSGSWDGFGIMIGFLPSKQFGFVMMGNTVDARNAQLELYLYLIDTLLGLSSSGRSEYIARMTQKMSTAKGTDSESIQDVKRRLFPCLPEHPLPHSLLLREYAGAYQHAGYGSVTLSVKGGRLCADLTDRVGKGYLALEHASGEFFVVRLYAPGRESSTSTFFRAEFQVDSAGVAQALGVEWEPSLAGEKVWFKRQW